MQYINFPITDLGAGIDALSSENKIGEGYSERLENVDPTPEGYLQKRAGYGSASGYLPLRVIRVVGDPNTDELCFYLDSGIDATSIDMSELRSTPLVVHGSLDANYGTNWDFGSSTGTKYYSGFTPDTRFTFSTGSSSHVIEGSTHNLGETLWARAAVSDDEVNNNNTTLLPDEIEVTISNDNVTVYYTNGGPAFDGFVYLLSGATSLGTSYSATGVWGGSLSISAGTHQLGNYNIITALYEGDGTTWREVQAEVSISLSGTVTFTSTAFVAPYTNYMVLLRAADSANSTIINVPANTTVSKNFPVTGDFLVYSIYEDDGTTRTSVIPNSVSVADGIATVNIINSSTSVKLFQFNWEYAYLVTNKICVTNSANATGSLDTSKCQIDIYGVSHGSIYSSSATRAGWVNHIDGYRSEGEEYVVCGLGGVLYTPTQDSTYLLGTAYPRLRNRLSSNVIVGPAFGTNTSRTRGECSFTGDGEGYAEVASIAYQTGSGYVRYTLATPSLVVTGTPISMTANLEDRLEVRQAAHSVHNGTFTVKAVSYGISSITIDVENTDVSSSDFDETETGATAGIFTDQFPLTSNNDYIPGDRLTNSAIGEDTVYTVTSGTTSVVVFTGADDYRAYANSIRVAGTRTSSIMPLRTVEDLPYSDNFVVGDVVSITGYSRAPQITFVNPLDDVTVSVSAASGVGTITLGSGNTNRFQIGQLVVLLRAGAFSGEHTISEILSSTELQFSTGEEGSSSGTLMGHTIQLYESIEWADTATNDTTIQVVSRWAPVESPIDSFNITPKVPTRYFDTSEYINQPIIRSTISNDNMYFTNYEDEVLKYDGTSLYRAGLPNWQPQAFLTVDPNYSGKIFFNLDSIGAGDVTSITGPLFKVDYGLESTFAAGDYVVIADGTYTITAQISKVWATSADGYIKITYYGTIPAFTPATTTITQVGRYRYYYRLNLVDANNNYVVSATTGSTDYIVEMTTSAAIRHRIIGLPPYGVYDYDRIEVEIYRTKLGSIAPFYKITTLVVPFNNYDGYIDYVDTISDDTLTTFDVVATATVGAELGNTWSEPLRAKYITTADNRLLLANVRDYPKITTTFRDTGLTALGDYSNKRLLIRKANTDTSTVTDNINRMAYQWKTSGADGVTGITQISGNTYRITTAATTFSVGDWLYLFRGTAPGANTVDLQFQGWHQVTSIAGGGNTCDVVLPSTSYLWASASSANRLVVASTKTDIPVWLGTDYGYATSNGNEFGTTSLTYTALRRLVQAINASQRVCQTSNFTPWVQALGGSDYGGDTFVLVTPKSTSEFLEVLLPASIAGIDYYVNDIKRSASQEVAARTQVFGSRLLASYTNFPELFDSVTSSSTNSLSVFDINPADGQEITGIIPFFGESAFGGAVTDSIVIVFKTNSIYLVDLGGNSSGDTRIQKVDSRGLGCTAPFSIAPTQNGVMFANESGIYRIRRDLSIEYIGRKVERIWTEEVSKTQLGITTATYYPIENQYKITVATDSVQNSTSLVYNTVREYTADGYRAGSWTLYTNQPAIGYANLSSASYMASNMGDVYEIYTHSAEKPYRDNGAAITSIATLRSLDFGDASIRKAIGKVSVDYRTVSTTDSSDTKLLSSIDNKDQFEEADSATIKTTDTEEDGLGSTGDVKVRTIRYSIGRRKCAYFQLQFTNGVLDSPMEVSGINIRVAGLADRGIIQAKETQE